MKHLLTTGAHSKNLTKVFGADATFAGDAPVFDHPLYVLAFTNRSGSNLLAEYLVAHPAFVGFGEVLNKPPIMRMAEKHANFPDLMAQLVSQNTKNAPGRLFGVKANWDQLNMLIRHRIDRLFTGIRIIHIERNDILGQAISYHIAMQTNRWKSFQPGATDNGADGAPETEPQYDFDKIGNIMIGFREANISIRVTAEASGWPVFHTTYEQLVADPAAVVTRIFDWAGLPHDTYSLPETRLQKQVTSIGDEMRTRYLADYAATLGFAAAS